MVDYTAQGPSERSEESLNDRLYCEKSFRAKRGISRWYIIQRKDLPSESRNLLMIDYTTKGHSERIEEKQIKGYSRRKKDALIDKVNPNRDELYNNGVIAEIPPLEQNE